MSDTGKSAAPRTEGATATGGAETAATTSSEAATATCVEAATSAVPAEPSPARLGSPYRNGKRKEGKRRDRSNAQIFRHRNLPMSWASRVPGTLFRTTRCRNGCRAPGEGTCDSLGCGILLPGNDTRTTILEPAVGPRSNTTTRELPVPTAVPQLEKRAFKRLLLSMSALGQKRTFCDPGAAALVCPNSTAQLFAAVLCAIRTCNDAVTLACVGNTPDGAAGIIGD